MGLLDRLCEECVIIASVFQHAYLIKWSYVSTCSVLPPFQPHMAFSLDKCYKSNEDLSRTLVWRNLIHDNYECMTD
jgi:hypothetical protein